MTTGALSKYGESSIYAVSGPRRRSDRSVIDREIAYVLIVKGYCHGSRKDRGNQYTASDGLGVFAESPETGPSRNTLKKAGVKVTVLR